MGASLRELWTLQNTRKMERFKPLYVKEQLLKTQSKCLMLDLVLWNCARIATQIRKYCSDEAFFYHLPAEKSLTQFWNLFMVQYFMHDFETKVLEDMPLHLKILKHIKKKFSQLRVFPVWPNAVIWTQWCPLSSLTSLPFRQLQFLLVPFYNYSS